jgi:parallel beta-helix repeat protein
MALASAAQTLVPGGYVSGLWSASGSPYLIQGNVSIYVDSTLLIDPGVVVDFQGNYSLVVNGCLKAAGSPGDSIHFARSGGTWKGIRLINSSSDNQLDYCSIQGVSFQGALKCDSSVLVMSHCLISNNVGSGSNGAGGIFVVNSSPQISYCTVSDNVSNGNGGGISCIGGSSVLISHCVIEGNVAYEAGGGIYLSRNSSAQILNCAISGNFASDVGGGIAHEGPLCEISECALLENDANFGGGLWLTADNASLSNTTISHNGAQGEGGGLWIASDLALIARCLFENNGAYGYVGWTTENGGAIFAENCDSLTIDHSTFVYNRGIGENSAGGIQLTGNTSAVIMNNIMKGGGSWGMGVLIKFEGISASVTYNDLLPWPGALPFSGNDPAQLLQLTQQNANGDPCDIYQNITGDPMFVNAYGDFQLQEGSPCIDAGDPASPFDPDNTVTDMGRYFFDQRAPDLEISTSLLDFGSVNLGEVAQLPLVIYNIGSDTLQIYDIGCGDPVFSTDWTPSQNQILPGENLQIMVSFAPVSIQSYEDSLYIENNSEPCAVSLVGSSSGTADVGGGSNGKLPRGFALQKPYPNPFNPTATFQIELPVATRVQLTILDVGGRIAAVVMDGMLAAGFHEVIYEALDLPSGLYLYRLETGGWQASGKMVLMK